MDATNLKICSKCNLSKSLDCFGNHPLGKNGKQPQCNACKSKEVSKYNKTKSGIIKKIYSKQRANSRKRGHLMPDYLLTDLRSWALSQQIFHKLYDEWVSSGYDKALSPSFDRIDDYKPYSLDNINIMTWHENNHKGAEDRKNGINNKGSKSIIQMTIDCVFVKRYHSGCFASRDTGIDQGSISACCRGVRKTAGGYIWRFE